MKSLLMSTTIILLILIVIILNLLYKIRILSKKNKYVDEANMWHKLAVTDVLTGLYNRNAYNLHIDKCGNDIKENIRGIILFDVDNFKIINDTMGHLAGDVVLKNVAKILLDVFPEPQCKVFRIGGDEFSVLTEDISEKEIINSLIVLEKRLNLEGNTSLSKGYSIIKDNAEEAFEYADDMLYADKLSKKLRSASLERK